MPYETGVISDPLFEKDYDGFVKIRMPNGKIRMINMQYIQGMARKEIRTGNGYWRNEFLKYIGMIDEN